MRIGIKGRQFQGFSPGVLGLLWSALPHVDVSQSVPRFNVRETIRGYLILFLRFREFSVIEIKFAESVSRLTVQRRNVHGTAEFRLGASGIAFGDINTAEMNVRCGKPRTNRNGSLQILLGIFIILLSEHS